jgi:hypothetical protein
MLLFNLFPLLISPGLYVIHIAAEMAPVAKVNSTYRNAFFFLSFLLDFYENIIEVHFMLI